MRKTQFRMH